jgi:hypothetical protein
LQVLILKVVRVAASGVLAAGDGAGETMLGR